MPTVLLLLTAILAAGAPTPNKAKNAVEAFEPPSFLIVLIDDVGIDQLSAYRDVNGDNGSFPFANTPAIQDLVDNGVLFRQARACPVCSPSRAALQCGKYGYRTGVGTVVAGKEQGKKPTYSQNFFEFSRFPQADELTLAELVHLHSPDYNTGFFGKMHLQINSSESWPWPHTPKLWGSGDDYAISVLGYDIFRGSRRNLEQDAPGDTREVFTFFNWYEDFGGGTITGQSVGGPNSWNVNHYNTVHQRDRLEDWILGLCGEPFLAVWNLNDAHGPLQWPPGGGRIKHGFAIPRYEPDGSWKNTRLRAKIEVIDTELGILVQSLKRAGLYQNTYIIVMGDNGTSQAGFTVNPAEVRYPDGHPLHKPGDENTHYTSLPYDPEHMKGTPYEGGVRVPLIVTGPEVVAGAHSNVLVDIVDVFKTVHELAQDPTGPLVALPVGNYDSISFKYALQTPAASSVRRFSHAANFKPNGVGPYDFVGVKQHDRYFIWMDNDDDLWKIVEQWDNQTMMIDNEFYDLNIDPRESSPLTLPHPKYNEVRAEFQAFLETF